MRILLTGMDGYIGWPLALRLSRQFPEAKILGVDSLGRRRWVRQIGSVSAIPIQGMEQRLRRAKALGFSNLAFKRLELTRQTAVEDLVSRWKPDAILHLAAQPSAPFAEAGSAHAQFTQSNNVLSTLNLLWSLKKAGRARDCLFVETTTMGIYGSPEIPVPEGFTTFEVDGTSDRLPFPAMASSWYHMTKAHDFNNFHLAHRQWKLPVADFRTGIVYGDGTEETRMDEALATRFDFDFYFGVVIHRFCAMAVAGAPMSIYGTGERGKPFISLEDCVSSLARSLDKPSQEGIRVFNQFTEIVTVTELARAVEGAAREQGLSCHMEWIENPRTEKDTHRLRVESPAFAALLGPPSVRVPDGIRTILSTLMRHGAVVRRHSEAMRPRPRAQ